MKNENIYVTRPHLPDLNEFVESLKQIWDSKVITNIGAFHKEFELELCKYLGVKNISLFSNGTLALITGLQALRITGEVITTPFSFVATTHALYWNGITPVFCDIEEDTFNINPEKIEALITPKTTAILPVHVYGNPCNMNKIEQIAETYGLKVINDAAHAFGVTVNGSSILNAGDISILSFHATKTFNTIEGGAIITNDEKLKKRIGYLKNFGFADEITVVAPGINAKMNELVAAYGLIQLKTIDEQISSRKSIASHYRELLKDIHGIRILYDIPAVKHNYTYFPILINKSEFGKSRDEVYELLKKNNIFSRRYFYPLISQFPTYKGLPSASLDNLPVATRIAQQVLCLPIYADLSVVTVDNICNLILSS